MLKHVQKPTNKLIREDKGKKLEISIVQNIKSPNTSVLLPDVLH